MYKFCRTAEHFPLRLLGLSKPHSRGFQTVNKFLVLEARMEGISQCLSCRGCRKEGVQPALSGLAASRRMQAGGPIPYVFLPL